MISKIKLIVAVSENGIIGNKGEIPWRLPEEMKHFKETTSGHTVVMGFKTWQSILPFNKDGYLDNRDNIVLTTDPQKCKNYTDKYGDNHPWLKFYDSSFDIVSQARINDRFKVAVNHIFVIGGAQIYNKYLAEDVVDEIILTRVKMKFPGDTKFPAINEANWTLLSVEKRQYFDILHYQRAR